MPSISPISGFAEWLPHQKIAELKLLEQIRSAFECFGFLPIETRSVEPLSVLLSKGDDKEIYTLGRLHDSEASNQDEKKLGLHFDLTIPFARYVQEFQNELQFPFKRYQIQKVWRGERKQEGRYREFYQCDIDIVGMGSLSQAYDAEFAELLLEVFQKLPVPPIQLKINNRKVLQGFYLGLGIEQSTPILRILDKLAKIGPHEVVKLLLDTGLSEDTAKQCLALASIQGTDDVIERIRGLGVEHALLDEGLAELQAVLDFNRAAVGSRLEIDASIARGLDYYSGTVYEGYLVGHTSLGAVCAGGRYDNLIQGARQPMPGLGVSIGITRILGYLFGRGLLRLNSLTPVKVLVILNDESSRSQAFNVAQQLRARQVPTDVYHQAHAFGKQIKAAEKRGIPYVCFTDEQGVQIKNLATAEQSQVNLDTWLPDAKYDEASWIKGWDAH